MDKPPGPLHTPHWQQRQIKKTALGDGREVVAGGAGPWTHGHETEARRNKTQSKVDLRQAYYRFTYEQGLAGIPYEGKLSYEQWIAGMR